MADLAGVRAGLAVYLQKASAKDIQSNIFDTIRTLGFLFAFSGQKTAIKGLGIPMDISSGPQAGASGFAISAMSGLGRVNVAKISTEREYRPLLRTGTANLADVKQLSDYDSLPDVSSWQTNSLVQQTKQPVVKFARVAVPYSIPHTDKWTAIANGNGVEGGAARALGPLYDGILKEARALAMTRMSNQVLGISDLTDPYGVPTATSTGNGLPADETQNQWSSIHSIKNMIGGANTCCGIDRTLSTCPSIWKGIYSTNYGTDSFKNVIRDTNVTQGLARKGGRVSLVGVGDALWLKAIAEFDSEHSIIYTNELPEFKEMGSRYEVCRFMTGNGPCYVFHEPLLPAGEAFLIDPSSWTVAIHAHDNFRVTGPVDLTETQASPDERDVGNLIVQYMMVCEAPRQNRYITGWT